MCYCRHCRENFKKASGLDLPRPSEILPRDPRDRVRREYTLWRQKRLFELWDVWDSAIRKANPNARYIPNAGGGALSALDMKGIGERAPILFADRQARSGTMPIWANGKNGKEYRAAMGRKPIGGIFSVGVEEPYRWKDSVQSPEEIKAWVVDGIANGLRPWYAKFNAKVIDKRWLRPVEEVYEWHWRNDKYLRNLEPLARVAMVYSQQTAWFYGGEEARRKVEDHTLGYYQALVEARLPFEMAHDGLLDAARLSRFRTLILPNIAALSTQQCAQLRDFVQRGGGLVATYETSLYDEQGERRPDFGLADLFGASYAGKVEFRMQNSYLTVEGAHPLVAGLENAPRIVNSVGRVHVRTVRKPVAVPLTLVPSYPDLPMEDVFPRVAKTDEPQVYLQEFGQGRVVYFPGDLDRTYWEVLQRDHGRILRNAVLWAANEEQPATVAGPGMLDVTLWRQAQSMTLHLVNLTNPMAMRGSYREVIPVGPQRVRIRAPEGVKPGAVKLLVSGRAISPRVRNGVLEMEIPSIDLHEVVAVDFV
jgi:glycosyl hydrolase family 42 (putative beta-galactosidase)